MNERELLANKSAKVEEARALNSLAEAQARDFTPEEKTQWDALQKDITSLARKPCPLLNRRNPRRLPC